jgi:hypothetical protein
MVSEKLVIVLIIVAILLSVVSMAVTISTANTKLIPNTGNVINDPDDSGSAKVGIVLTRPTG